MYLHHLNLALNWSIKIRAYLQNIAKIYHSQVQFMRRIYKANVKIKRNKSMQQKNNTILKMYIQYRNTL